MAGLGALRARIGLTGRAWAFLASGLAMAVLGLARGLVPAVQFGALLAAVPLISAALTRGPGRLDLSRTLSQLEVATGEHLNVTVHVRGRFPRGRTLLLEDLAPPALGGAHRLALGGLSGRAIARPHYRARGMARGIHHLGPMHVHVVDAFGMVHRVHRAGGRDEVAVVPQVVALDPLVLGGATVGAGSGRLGAHGAASDDVIPRPYRPGDEYRRIDWKAVARTGDLMVRTEETPWRSALTVVVDMHDGSHQGTEPDSSLDVALTMVASVGCMALAAGWDLAVRTTDDVVAFEGSPMTGVEAERRLLLRALAALPRTHVPVPAASLGHSADASGPVVLVTGAVSLLSARSLAGIARHSPQRIVVMVEADQWRPSGRAHPAEAPAQSVAGAFRDAGWRVVRLPRGGSLAAAWAAAGAAS